MLVYFLSQSKEAEKFASLSDFISEYLTPEGFQLFNHLTAFIPAYARQFDAGSLADYARATANIKGNYSRPDSGLSVITGALKMSAVNLGAKLYKNQKKQNHRRRSREQVQANNRQLYGKSKQTGC